MSYTSTLAMRDMPLIFPAWFQKKYKNDIQFRKSHLAPPRAYLTACGGVKIHNSTMLDFNRDLQKVLRYNASRDKYWQERPLTFVWLHECTGITRIKIFLDKIILTEPTGWQEVKYVSHHESDDCDERDFPSHPHIPVNPIIVTIPVPKAILSAD